jgi:hypothetical protein
MVQGFNRFLNPKKWREGNDSELVARRFLRYLNWIGLSIW